MNEAEFLFTQVLDCDRASLYLNRNRVLSREKTLLISSALKRRMKRQPLQYILGNTEFMGLKFKVTPDVLIPRPETELLVEAAIELVRSQESGVRSQEILDLGTGSGCIAVSLAKFLPEANITATDISDRALEVAKENAALNKVNINFIQSDLFHNYELRTTSYELIICNPPYISSEEIANLQPEIQYEPRIALDGGKDGLDFYRRIAAEAKGYLKRRGILIMEMGFGQSQAIEDILENSGELRIIDMIKDYSGISRIILTERN